MNIRYPIYEGVYRILTVLLSPYCSLVSCVIFGRMQPKTGTTTSSIMNTSKSRQGNKRGINKHLTLRIMGTTEHEEPRFFFILNKGRSPAAKSPMLS